MMMKPNNQAENSDHPIEERRGRKRGTEEFKGKYIKIRNGLEYRNDAVGKETQHSNARFATGNGKEKCN